MTRTPSFIKYCLIAAAAGACAVAIALRPPEQEILKMLPAAPEVASLDCAVVQRDRMSEPDLEAPCSMIA